MTDKPHNIDRLAAALAPCPFCGGEMKHLAPHEFNTQFGPRQSTGRWSHPAWTETPIKQDAVRCPAYSWGAWDDEAERLTAWNRRAVIPNPSGFVLVPNKATPEWIKGMDLHLLSKYGAELGPTIAAEMIANVLAAAPASPVPATPSKIEENDV